MSLLHIASRFDQEPTLTKQQIATHLAKSTRWVEIQVKDRGMPYLQVGGQKRFRLGEVLAWLRGDS